MTERSVYGEGPKSLIGSIIWVAFAVFIALVQIALKLAGWYSWITLIGLLSFPILFGFVGVVGIAVYSDPD